MRKLFITLLCVGLLLGDGVAIAQLAKQQADEVVRLYTQGRYAEAAELAAEVLSIREKALGADHLDVAVSLINLAELYRSQGRYAEAEPLYKRSLAILEKALGADNPHVAISLDKLAELYWNLGRYAEAESLVKRSLAMREKALGADHPDVAISLNNLAELYRSQGRYAEAEPLCKRSLVIREKALGADHPDVATSLNNLALLYQDQGRYAEAEPLYKRSLTIREKALGADHPHVATSLNNLTELYRSQGRYAEAEPLYKRSLVIREKALGADHPDVANSLNSLGGLYWNQGRYAEAEPLLKRSLAIMERALGADHPDVATSLNNLTELYRSQGRYAETELLYKRSLAIREKALGADHPHVATSLNNLALLYQDQGRYAEAEPLYKRSLAICEKAFGADHPDVAVNLNNLAALYWSQGRYAEAEPLNKRSLAIRQKAFGPDHPDVAVSFNILATLYWSQGRYAEAEPLYKRSLAILEKALGADHPNVASSLNNLAELYRSQGRYAEAEPLYKRSLVIREKALGADHPDVANSLGNLAELHRSQGRYAEAEPLYKRSLAIWEKALGAYHPHVATSLNNLAELYRSQGRYAEAEPLYKRSLAIWEKALGADHPHVATSFNNLGGLYWNQGRYAQAEPLFKRGLAILEKALVADHPNVATSLGNLAELHRAQGRVDVAVAHSRRAVSILAKHLATAPVDATGGTNAEQRSKRSYFLQNVALVFAANEAKSGSETFRVAQLAQVSSAARAVAGMAARFAAGSDALAALVRERQDLAGRWQGIDVALVKAASQPPDKRKAAAEAALRADLAAAGQRLEALDAQIAKDFPRYAELSQPPPLELEAAQALLALDEALLVYLTGDDESWLWVLRRDRMAMHRIAVGGKALEVEVKALRERLDPNLNPGLKPKPFDAARAHALYEKILAPARALLDGAQHVLVVPDGALESLPMGVLVTAPPTAEPLLPADHRAIAWFAREHALTVLPSVGSLRVLRQFASGMQASSPFVGIGNPVLEGPPLAQYFGGTPADVTQVRWQLPLPETANELRAIAKVMGADERDLYLAERASEPQLRQAGLERYRVIAFATHGLTSGQLKGLSEPALVLTPPREASPENDGLLTASKIATFKLNADWVVLSACNTAAADGTPDAGGLSGLAKAFFYAGARSLLVSHWSVPSQATVKLITGMFEALAKDSAIGRAEALRRAEMAMLDPSSPPEFAHPLYWAPFILAGEGGPKR